MGTDSEIGGSQWAAECFPQHSKLRRVPDEAEDHAVAEYVKAGAKLAPSGSGGLSPELGVTFFDNDGVAQSLNVGEIAGIGRNLPGMISSGDMYKPHIYMPSGLPGTIGAPCLMCGGHAADPLHNNMNEPKPLPIGEIRVRAIDDKVAGNVIRIEIDNPPTQEARDILMNILPGVLEAWLLKNKDYGDSDELKSLGARAEFVRLWNKAMKLKAGLWEGRELSGEQIPEIMGDMIAHLLLALNRA